MKKTIIIAVIILILISIPIKIMIDEKILKAKFADIRDKYGASRAADLERLYRLETAHFKSEQFKNTGSPGMEAHAPKFPYGWTSLLPFWTKYPQHAPVGFYSVWENPGLQNANPKQKNFLKFRDFESALLSLNEYAEKYNIERWYSTRPEDQQKYRAALNQIKVRFT